LPTIFAAKPRGGRPSRKAPVCGAEATVSPSRAAP
jgi:hypothetical protein